VSDFASLMASVRAGAEIVIVIENGERPVAVLHAAEPVRRSISDCIALAKAHEEETGKAPVLDPDFAETWKKLSATASRGARRGRVPFFQYEDDTPTNTLT
jgi:antitoxin (DNA-binding transcriptional repressor) of toxin-antitoxin stability system